MKYIFLLFLFIPFLGFSQAVQKNDFEIAGGVGFGIYGVNNNDPQKDTSNENSLAAAGLVNFSMHYAVIKSLSIGILAERNGFVTEKDSSNKGVSLNIGLNLQYRLINKEKTVVFANLMGGYTHFKYEDHKERVVGKGTLFQIGIGFKHYFTKTVGMFIESNYSIYPYNKLVSSHGEVLKTGPVNNQEDLSIFISGLNLRFGLTFNL
jgi:hypothetical protein